MAWPEAASCTVSKTSAALAAETASAAVTPSAQSVPGTSRVRLRTSISTPTRTSGGKKRKPPSAGDGIGTSSAVHSTAV